DEDVEADFTFVQQADGSLVFVGDLNEPNIGLMNLDIEVAGFEGTDIDGRHVSLLGKLLLVNSNFSSGENGTQILITGFPNEFRVGDLEGEVSLIRFDIVNTKLSQGLTYEAGNHGFALQKVD